MSKNSKISIFIVVAILIIAGIIAILSFKDKAPAVVQDNSPVLGENVGEAENSATNQVLDANYAAEEIATATPEVLEAQEIAAKEMIVEATQGEFKVEFMSDAEKEKMGISLGAKVQILGRDSSGSILGYKFITTDEDIVTSLDKLEF